MAESKDPGRNCPANTGCNGDTSYTSTPNCTNNITCVNDHVGGPDAGEGAAVISPHGTDFLGTAAKNTEIDRMQWSTLDNAIRSEYSRRRMNPPEPAIPNNSNTQLNYTTILRRIKRNLYALNPTTYNHAAYTSLRNARSNSAITTEQYNEAGLLFNQLNNYERCANRCTCNSRGVQTSCFCVNRCHCDVHYAGAHPRCSCHGRCSCNGRTSVECSCNIRNVCSSYTNSGFPG